ncbi:MAG: ATP-dependent zinc metalloprotease FtsH [Dehalococcoidales bacterium]|nr:ATP-dependent zinc metalloprotease FtsH [Dehalococcoidales bacterium]
MKSLSKRTCRYAAGIVITAVILALASCRSAVPADAIEVDLSEAIALSQGNNVESITLDTSNGIMVLTAAVDGPPLQITDVNGSPVQVVSGSQLMANTGNLNLAELQELGLVLPARFSTTSANNNLGAILISWLPLLLLFFLLFILFRSGSSIRGQTSNYSRSRARLGTGNTPGVTFSDVAGEEEAKQDLHEVVDFLKNRSKFQAVGARIPKGILLVGPPGTGKTLLARAVAGEAGVPFFSISGSEFVEVFVGVGASRVRDLFEQAKQNKPCIIFIDEIDAVGRRRGSGLSGSSHEEREQTLNQILTEMDGFTPNAGVIVLAATNRPDVLDPALLRPGRFDRRITLELPDIGERLAILKVHAVGKPLHKSVDLETIAKETHGFSGADLANLVNEAAILTARRNETSISMNEMEEAIDRIVAGPQKKSRKISQQEKRMAAYHEAGHALVARMLPNADPVHKVSIITRGGMGGYTRLLPSEEHYLMTRSQFKDMLSTFLGGHVAEEMIFHEVTTGPHSDIKQATAIARKMITEFGMSESLPLRTFGEGEEDGPYIGMQHRDYSEDVARQIDEEVRNLIDSAKETARQILQENRLRLIHLAEKLIVTETLEGKNLERAFTEPIPSDETYGGGEQTIEPVKSISNNRQNNRHGQRAAGPTV